MDPLGAVCSMTNPSQSNQISMTNFVRSQQKKLRKIQFFLRDFMWVPPNLEEDIIAAVSSAKDFVD